MHIFQELKTLISHIYFKTTVIDNLHLFRKWRGSSPNFFDSPLVVFIYCILITFLHEVFPRQGANPIQCIDVLLMLNSKLVVTF